MAQSLIERRLLEAEHTLEAICEGRVDAVVVSSQRGHQIFSLEGPDYPFRTFVESMQEGALTIAADGRVLYANAFMAELLQRPLSELVGAPFVRFVAPESEFAVTTLLQQGL